MTRRLAFAAAAAALFVLPACSAAEDLAKSAEDIAADIANDARRSAQEKAASIVKEYTDPWAAGCLIVDVALRANHVDRAPYLNSLEALGKSPGLPTEYVEWIGKARDLVALTDPTQASQETKDKINGPCKDHGRPLGALS